MTNRPTSRGTMLGDSLLGGVGAVPSNSLAFGDAPFPHRGLSHSLFNIAAMVFRGVLFLLAGAGLATVSLVALVAFIFL